MPAEAQSSQLEPASNATISRSAFNVTLGGLLSLLTGLASQVIVAWLFGAGAEMDAFLTAMTVPTYLWVVLVGGLAFVFVPMFVEEETVGSVDTAWALVGTLFWLIAIFLTAIAIVVFLFAPQIIALIAPGMRADKADLSARMLSILIFTVPLLSLGSLTESIQNARGSFFWPAAARALGSLGNVIILLLLYRLLGPIALAWGNLLSTLLAASVPAFPVLRHGWTRLIPLTDRQIREIATRMAPLIVSVLFSYSSTFFERYFASMLADGSLSYLGYAARISNMLVNVLAVGIASAILPAMARTYAQRGEGALAERSQYALRLTLATCVPATALLTVVATPLVTMLFERGAFEHQATLAVSQILLFVLVGNVVFRMLGNVISQTFYVLKDTYTWPLINSLSIGLYIVLGKVLIGVWDYVGLAIAAPIQAGACILVTFILLSMRLKSFLSAKLFKDVLLYIIASSVATLAAWLLTHMLSPLSVFLILVIPLLISSFLYVILLLWFDREIAVAILEIAGLRQILRWLNARW